MVLVYSALRPVTENFSSQTLPAQQASAEWITRYDAYCQVCAKYRAEIEAIQKFFPGWLPSPPTGK